MLCASCCCCCCFLFRGHNNKHNKSTFAISLSLGIDCRMRHKNGNLVIFDFFLSLILTESVPQLRLRRLRSKSSVSIWIDFVQSSNVSTSIYVRSDHTAKWISSSTYKYLLHRLLLGTGLKSELELANENHSQHVRVSETERLLSFSFILMCSIWYSLARSCSLFSPGWVSLYVYAMFMIWLEYRVQKTKSANLILWVLWSRTCTASTRLRALRIIPSP